MQRIREELRRARRPAVALVMAFLVGAILIVVTDVEHLRAIGTDPLAAIGGALAGVVNGYPALFSGAIGDPARIVAAIQSGSAADIAAALRPISETLLSATPFIFAGLGLAVSFHAGLFNFGVDGQFLIGGMGTLIAATLVAGSLPPFLALAVAVIGGTIAGAAYGFVPGFLKARTGAHEVITTLMFNGVAPSVAFLMAGLIQSTPPSAMPAVPRILDLRTIRVDYGFVAAVAMAAVVSFLLFRTTRGFELRATGFSRAAARGAGIGPGRTTMLAMAISGGLVGMGSAFFSLGPALGLGGGVPTNDFGYVAIALALLAGRRPSGVVVAALLYGALTTGAKNMVIVAGVPLDLLIVVVACALMFMAAPDLTRSVWRLKRPTPGVEIPAQRARRP